MTKMRERTVVRMTMENETSRMTKPKLPSSPGAGSESENWGEADKRNSSFRDTIKDENMHIFKLFVCI